MSERVLDNANDFINSIVDEYDLANDEDFKYYSIFGEISARIAGYRIDHGLSQDQLAEILQVSQVMVSKYESGEYNISIQKLNHICHVLGIQLDVTLQDKSQAEKLVSNTEEAMARRDASSAYSASVSQRLLMDGSSYGFGDNVLPWPSESIHPTPGSLKEAISNGK